MQKETNFMLRNLVVLDSSHQPVSYLIFLFSFLLYTGLAKSPTICTESILSVHVFLSTNINFISTFSLRIHTATCKSLSVAQNFSEFCKVYNSFPKVYRLILVQSKLFSIKCFFVFLAQLTKCITLILIASLLAGHL